MLLVASIAIGFVWCGILPRVANQPQMQQRLEFLDEQGIDASAMFYTELDVMEGILRDSGVR